MKRVQQMTDDCSRGNASWEADMFQLGTEMAKRKWLEEDRWTSCKVRVAGVDDR